MSKFYCAQRAMLVAVVGLIGASTGCKYFQKDECATCGQSTTNYGTIQPSGQTPMGLPPAQGMPMQGGMQGMPPQQMQGAPMGGY